MLCFWMDPEDLILFFDIFLTQTMLKCLNVENLQCTASLCGKITRKSKYFCDLGLFINRNEVVLGSFSHFLFTEMVGHSDTNQLDLKIQY